MEISIRVETLLMETLTDKLLSIITSRTSYIIDYNTTINNNLREY